PVRDDRRHRRRPARRDRRDQGTPDAAEPQARHLRRARRRSGVDPVLREGRARLRELFAVSRARRPPRRGAGRAPGEGRGLIKIYIHEGGATRSVESVDPAWLKAGSGVWVWVDLDSATPE